MVLKLHSDGILAENIEIRLRLRWDRKDVIQGNR
jgi:hypothetical protein